MIRFGVLTLIIAMSTLAQTSSLRCEQVFKSQVSANQVDQAIFQLAEMRMQIDLARANGDRSILQQSLVHQYQKKSNTVLQYLASNRIMTESEFQRSIENKIAEFQGVQKQDQNIEIKRRKEQQDRVQDIVVERFYPLAEISHDNSLNQVSFSPKREILFTADANRGVFTDLKTRKELFTIHGVTLLSGHLSWSAHGDLVGVSTPHSAEAKVIDVKNKEELVTITHEKKIVNTQISPSGKLFAVASEDGAVSITDIQNAQMIRELKLGTRVGRVQFSPDSKYLLLNLTNKTMLIYRVDELLAPVKRSWLGTVEPSPVIKRDDVSSYISNFVGASGEKLMFHKQDGRFEIIDLQTGQSSFQQITKNPNFYFDQVSKFELSPDGRYLAFHDYPAYNLLIVDTKTWNIVHKFEGPQKERVEAFEFVPGKNQIMVSYRTKIGFYDLTTGKQEEEIQDFGQSKIKTAKLSPDGEYLSVGFVAGNVQLRKVNARLSDL